MARKNVMSLAESIKKFIEIDKNYVKDQWALADLASYISMTYSDEGLKKLHHDYPKYQVKTLRILASNSRSATPLLRKRYPTFGWEIFRAARHNSLLFLPGRPEAKIEYWLNIANAPQTDRSKLMRMGDAALKALAEDPRSTPDELAFADQAYAEQIQTKLSNIERSIQQFNEHFSVRYGMTLSLCREPLKTPAE